MTNDFIKPAPTNTTATARTDEAQDNADGFFSALPLEFFSGNSSTNGYDEYDFDVLDKKDPHPCVMLGETYKTICPPGFRDLVSESKAKGRWDVKKIGKLLKNAGIDLFLLEQNHGDLLMPGDEVIAEFPYYSPTGELLGKHQVPVTSLRDFKFSVFFAEQFHLLANKPEYALTISSNPLITMGIMGAGCYSFAISQDYTESYQLGNCGVSFMGRTVFLVVENFSREAKIKLIAQLLAAGAKVFTIEPPNNFGNWLQSPEKPGANMKELLATHEHWETLPLAAEADITVKALCDTGMNDVLLEKCLTKLADMWGVPLKTVQGLVKKNQIEFRLLEFLAKNMPGMTLRELKSRLRTIDQCQIESTVGKLMSRGLVEKSIRKGVRGPATTCLKIAEAKLVT